MYDATTYNAVRDAYYAGYNPASCGRPVPENPYTAGSELAAEFDRGVSDGHEESKAWETFGSFAGV